MSGLDKRQARRARRRAALRHPLDGGYMTRSFKKYYDAAAKRHARLIEQPCSEDNCIELIDPETGENTGGWGPVGCPCQDEPTPAEDERPTR